MAEHIRVASLELPSGLPLRDVLEKIARAQGDRLRQAVGSLDERLPVSGTVPIRILVLNAADG